MTSRERRTNDSVGWIHREHKDATHPAVGSGDAMTACPLTSPTRPPLSPEVEDLLELAVYAARGMARQPAECATALQGTLVAAELLATLGDNLPDVPVTP